MANDPWAEDNYNDVWEEETKTETKETKQVSNPHKKNQGLIKGVFAVSGLMFKGAADFLLDLVK